MEASFVGHLRIMIYDKISIVNPLSSVCLSFFPHSLLWVLSLYWFLLVSSSSLRNIYTSFMSDIAFLIIKLKLVKSNMKKTSFGHVFTFHGFLDQRPKYHSIFINFSCLLQLLWFYDSILVTQYNRNVCVLVYIYSITCSWTTKCFNDILPKN